ncbi:hypothetical protein CLIB1444_11S02806 [[Candida] jaroonii]|uniref:Uncharacterized protein n=1 Tax=[Candida] jaroonii TaxID=467808 RepID=A0ACA9YE62_9ASCO|nr:hypothetical protein CLIB1444_11S02806 [[Candida] jaroonii]
MPPNSKWLINGTKYMLNYPKLTILIPITLIFIIAYDILYEFTIHPLNSLISNNHYQPIPKNYTFFEEISQLSQTDLSQYYGTLIFIDHDKDVINSEFLSNLSSVVNNQTYVLSPFTDWDFDYTSASKDFLLSNINYNANYLLNSFYLNNVTLLNHLIIKSNEIHFYIIHSSPINSLLETLGNPRHITHEDNVIMKEYLDYYLLVHGYKSTVMEIGLRIITILSVIYFLFHFYLSISNLHKLKSNFGILFGWMIEIVLSTTASIKIIEIMSPYEYWKQIFEPSTFFTKSVLVLTIAIVSSRNVMRIIIDLTYKNDFLTEDFDISDLSNKNVKIDKTEISNLSKLYRFYNGLSNNPDQKFEKLQLFTFLFRKLGINFHIKLPNTTKILFLDILSMFIMEKIGKFIIILNFDGNFKQYFDFKIMNFFKAMFIALIIDHFLQLTFLVGILLIDNHRINLSKILNDSLLDQDLKEINIFSYWLLKDKPLRNSWKYKLGTNLTFLVHPTSLISWIIILPILQFVNILTVFMNWTIYIPYNLTNSSNFIEPLVIKASSFDLFYYLEFMTLLILILCFSFIIFSLSNFKINEVNDTDFELSNKKSFKSIDLKRHNFDIIKLKSNNTSFLVSIGLDHKIFVWSPLQLSPPPNIASKIEVSGGSSEFWPINHLNISKDGEFILLVNYKFKIIKCFERKSQTFIWSITCDDLTENKILESFFREKTLPGFLKMKMLKNRPRRGSDASLSGNYPRPLNGIGENNEQLKKLEFVIVLQSGDIVTLSCNDGTIKKTNLIEKTYDEPLKLISAKKVITPRVNDRIVCQVDNRDLVVAVVVNNKWNFIPLDTTDELYNQASPIPSNMPTPMSLSRSSSFNYNFESHVIKKPTSFNNYSKFEINKPLIVPLEFVGMIIRVQNMVAELIDIQSGVIMKKVTIGRFKPSSFRVSHSEPTHCRFCGCASIQSLSIIYEDFDSKILIIHTLKIQNNRSKTSICLRVERDPREIRCVGFSNVIEDQFWFENINAWEVTDVNIIIGVKRDLPDSIPSDDEKLEPEYNTSKLVSLRSSKRIRSKNSPSSYKWEGFIITLNDGDMKKYDIPGIDEKSCLSDNVTCIEKFGFKSVAISFGNIIKILYLGNDKLIEENLYFNDLNNAINNELMFLSKRRKK